MSTLETFAQAVVNGLANGSSIALAAVGLTLSYGVSRFINFAYGEFLTYGAYAVLLVTGVMGALSLGLEPAVRLPIAAAVSILAIGVLAVVLMKVFYRPFEDRGQLPLLIVSFGVAFILRNVLRGIAGTDGKTYQLPLIRPLEFFGVNVAITDLAVIVTAVVVMLGVHVLLQYTMTGKKMRAFSGNRELARVSGIDTDRVSSITWLISGAIGGLAGVMFAVQFQPFKPDMGWGLLLVVFAATILGGIGKPYGAMVGAVVIGLTMSLGSTFLNSAYTVGYAFLILVLTLLLRPEGIFKGEI